MRSLRARFAPLVRAALALACLCSAAAAQLDLPSGPPKAPGVGPEPKTGRNDAGARRDGGLDLPSAEAPARPLTPGDAALPAATPPVGALDRAEFIVQEVARQADPGHALCEQAVAGLCELGEPGLVAARAMLRQAHAPTLVTGARVLLARGPDSDRSAVVARLRERMPGTSGAALLDALVAAAPELATPTLLVEMLDHPQGAVRTAAERSLRGARDPALLALLEPELASARSDTRLRALELVAGLDVPRRTELVLGLLGDPTARVAGRAAVLLADERAPEVDAALLALAFGGERIARPGAYALLAIAEREDRLGVALVGDEHVSVLLEHMVRPVPLVGQACAIALAGIGFRSERPEAYRWLDRDVPNVLVRALSGLEFHNDYSSVLPAAQRRLALLSGEGFAGDGIGWREWWLGAAPSFRARRACLQLGPESPLVLELDYRDAASAFRLVAAGAADGAPPGERAQAFLLSPADAERLFEVLRAEGVFDARRLPGVRGRTGAQTRTLRVALGQQEKRFTLGDGVAEEWMVRVVDAARASAEANAWQLWRDERRHATALEFYTEEAPWWLAERDELERDQRLAELVLAATVSAEPARRAAGIAELARLYARPSVANPAHLPRLIALFGDEAFESERSQRLVELALASARAALAPGEPLDAELGVRIIAGLLEGLQADGEAAIARVLAVSQPAAVRAAAAHPRATVRAAAARALGELGERLGREDAAVLLALLDDESRKVEAAALAALAAARVEEARAPILARSRASAPSVRVFALAALARIGGPGALETLVIGLSDFDPLVQRAAAEGLVALGDPASAPLLCGLLGRGPRSPYFAIAADGLRRLGAAAADELLRSAQSGPSEARREAALLLSELSVAEAAPILFMQLALDPGDERVARELAILTCVDLRAAPDPAAAWWSWWDGAPRGEALRWLVAGLERAGLRASVEELAPPGTLSGARTLLRVLTRPEAHLVERARRDLARLLARDIDAAQLAGAGRDDYLGELGLALTARFGEE